MLSSGALYTLLVPKIWDYAQQNIVNISSPSIGSSLLEVSNKNVRDVSHVLNAPPTSLSWNNDDVVNQKTLLLELYLACNVRKIILDLDKNSVPKEINISFSIDEKKINFKKLTRLRSTDLKRTRPFVISFSKPVQLKYLKFQFKLLDEEQNGKCKLNSLKVYGTPILNSNNLFELYHKNEDKLKALAGMLGLKNPLGAPNQPQNTQENDGTDEKKEAEEGVTIEILPDGEEEKKQPYTESHPSERRSKL
ncbi:predicted protein [Naegleria gruberi]|uniref:Predicted protein n=1 Tax=Naegleria gruberi TaxID=5762 RepID=D2VWN9_NAEGR|nr:uncharacterized protein NAEGRDRAFT_73450 [Naegleria gruberi]EFC38729.1 predicted protein [Naegleria gruberi]|eukprot:XP_002671473.1 predicted protein [Naegleria gruberi strain NEG-M]